MYLQVENLLTPAEVQEIAAVARSTSYLDGRASNPHADKQNAIADLNDAGARKAAEIFSAALGRNEEVKNFSFPRRVAVPRLARYSQGMYYAPHADAAFMPLAEDPLRADISCTAFISDPASYKGGELLIHMGSVGVPFKGKPGSAIFYPSTFIHQVARVTAGERVVMLTFIESQIVDQTLRELLYEINEVYALEGLKMDIRNATRLQRVSSNLKRLWSR